MEIRCKNCREKGYSTVFDGDTLCLADFIGNKTYKTREAGIRIKLCNCNRGKDLKKYFIIKKQFQK